MLEPKSGGGGGGGNGGNTCKLSEVVNEDNQERSLVMKGLPFRVKTD